MTIHQFPGTPRSDTAPSPLPPAPPPPPPRPPRGGEPWTHEDHETLLRLCRDGADGEDVAGPLGRSLSAVCLRARRMLPLDQRGMPADQVLHHLGTLARADDDYDWSAHLAATPPPRPVVQHLLPQPHLAGLPGLGDDELVMVAVSVALSPITPNARLVHGLAREVNVRGLVDHLTSAIERHTQAQQEDFLLSAHLWPPPAPWSDRPWWTAEPPCEHRDAEPPPDEVDLRFDA